MSKLVRALILGVTLAAMNLAGLTAVAHAKPTTTQTGRTLVSRLPNAKSGSPGATARLPRRSRPPRTPPSSGSWPESASPSPARHPPGQPPQRRPNPAGNPAGSSLPSVGSLPVWCWRAGWPCWSPDGQAAAPESGTRPDQRHGHAARWGCRVHPAAPSPCQRRIGPLACPAAAASCPCAGRAGALERITWPSTVAHDLRKRRVA
jgi:hypothetical protein